MNEENADTEGVAPTGDESENCAVSGGRFAIAVWTGEFFLPWRYGNPAPEMNLQCDDETYETKPKTNERK